MTLMSKTLNIVKYFCLFLLLGLIIYAYKSGIHFFGLGQLIYVGLLIIFLIIGIKDLKTKNSINSNNRYNILCILVFVIMSAIYLRALFDPHLFHNNPDFMKALDSYQVKLYGEAYCLGLDSIADAYILQNINYFLMMILALLGYRWLNKNNSK